VKNRLWESSEVRLFDVAPTESASLDHAIRWRLALIYTSPRCICGRTKLEFRWLCLHCRRKVDPDLWRQLEVACDQHLGLAVRVLGLSPAEVVGVSDILRGRKEPLDAIPVRG